MVGSFENGEQLLTYSQNHFPPEVIVSDIGLHGMNGIQLVERLRPIASGTRVVMLTGHEEKEKIHDTLRAGASGYLTKPLSGDDLIQAIYDVMRGGDVAVGSAQSAGDLRSTGRGPVRLQAHRA